MKRKIKGFIIALLFGLVSPFSGNAPRTAAQTPSPVPDKYAAKLKAFEGFVRERMKADRAVGMTIGFIKDDDTWVKAFGYADLENGLSTKPESAYRLASLTKPMTAVAALQLVEQGKINLDDEIQKYVPYYPK